MPSSKFRITLSEDNAVYVMRMGDEKSKGVDAIITAYRMSKSLNTVERVDERIAKGQDALRQLIALRKKLIDEEPEPTTPTQEAPNISYRVKT